MALADLDRRRSVELGRSSRRYDEHWGAAEQSDTRLKCGDGVVHHVHSQLLSCWSPVLRDMLALFPTPHLLESTHGPAFALHVEEDSASWAALLDQVYPVPTPAPPMPWELLEHCLLLADKYDMACVRQRLAAGLLDQGRCFSLDPSQPNFALRWLALADRLQLGDVAARISGSLQAGMAQLGQHPEAMAAVLQYAQQHLSKDQLLQLLQLSMQQAASSSQAQAAAQAQLQQSREAATSLLLQQQQQQLGAAAVSAAAFGGLLSHHQARPQQTLASPSCSGTSSPCCGGSSSDEASSDKRSGCGGGRGPPTPGPLDGAEGPAATRQRLEACMASALFAPAQLGGCGKPPSPAVCPVPAFCAAPLAPAQQQQQHVFALQVDARAPTPPSFGFGVNGGSASIADWMLNCAPSQPDSMIS